MLRFLFIALFAASPLYAASQVKGRTFPMPPKVVEDKTRKEAASMVPDPIENYKFIVRGEVDGKVFYPSKVPLWRLDGYRISAGTVPVGSEFKPDYVRG